MPIQSQTAIDKPPTYLVHQYAAGTDTIADLEAWAETSWSPLYSSMNPAFTMGPDGVLHYNQGGQQTGLVPDTYWIVFNTVGSISVLSPASFVNRFELETS